MRRTKGKNFPRRQKKESFFVLRMNECVRFLTAGREIVSECDDIIAISAFCACVVVGIEEGFFLIMEASRVRVRSRFNAIRLRFNSDFTPNRLVPCRRHHHHHHHCLCP